MQDLLQSAITKIRTKISPNIQSKGVFIPEEEYRSLCPMLDIFDDADEDELTRTKFIYEFLGENPKDKLLSIYTKLGQTPPNERKIDRVYRYCRLQEQSNKALTRYEQLQGDINAISSNR
jgi:hypothetical protein